MAFDKATEILWKKMGSHGIMVLSTCSEDRVTSRQMSVVVIGGKFYCQTNENYLKFRQLAANPNVALCSEIFSIEGICKNIGKPCDNLFFIQSMQQHFPEAVKRWSALTEECVLEITPVLIRSWIYEDNMPYIEYYDFDKYEYRKESQ